MGRDYYGFVNGRIPRFVKDELPFSQMCCSFTGYVLRYEDCGCLLYEYETDGTPALYTECKYGSKHKEITSDKDFARWVCWRYDIDKIHEKRKDIEMLIPIKSYVYLDEDHEIVFRNVEQLDSLSYDTNNKIWEWCILTELLVAFDRYMTSEYVVFTSETG